MVSRKTSETLRVIVVCLEYLCLAVCAGAIGVLMALWASMAIVHVLLDLMTP